MRHRDLVYFTAINNPVFSNDFHFKRKTKAILIHSPETYDVKYVHICKPDIGLLKLLFFLSLFYLYVKKMVRVIVIVLVLCMDQKHQDMC